MRAATARELRAEMNRARAKFPGTRHLLAALVEEVGELHRAFLEESDDDHVREEAIQVACVALRIAEEGEDDFNRTLFRLRDEQVYPKRKRIWA